MAKQPAYLIKIRRSRKNPKLFVGFLTIMGYSKVSCLEWASFPLLFGTSVEDIENQILTKLGLKKIEVDGKIYLEK